MDTSFSTSRRARSAQPARYVQAQADTAAAAAAAPKSRPFGKRIKMAGWLFVIFILLCSDVFIDQVLRKINGAADIDSTTTKGTIIQGICLCIAFLILESLMDNEVL